MGKMELTFPCQISSRIDLAKIQQFVEKMNRFNGYILIETNEKTINAKSLLSMWVLTASLTSGGTALLRISGPDAEIAMEDLKNLLSGRF
ncbi:HPr family phosphocarrier protein [Bacillus songklensis]|uniref:HPr family phosphocarrier protein n=1 Tax=Bacillus songklensis TaxID=1069116 RepID=A0ABV8B316_9BACI